tara:strand:+ start:1644 stop:2912 length:1269 start_codon:yes stop_codon:yes gene_type:complete
MFEIEKVNGLTLIFSPFKDIQTASLGVFFKVGSRYEKKTLKGIAHFLEHMVFKGSKNYSHLKIKREVEGRGGSLNAFTSQEITAYYAHFLKKNLNSALDIILDMVINPTISESDIKKERNVILEEIKMYNDLPSSRASILLDNMIWQRHPLGQEVIGYSETVNKIKRSDLINFKNFSYNPSRMVISFSGDFPKNEIIKYISKKIHKKNTPSNLKIIAPQRQSGINIAIETKNLEQTHLCLGFRGLAYKNPLRTTIQLINVILGANMSSRLFEELREKRSLCYDISTEVRKYQDSGAFTIHTGLDKNSIILALETILRTLAKLKSKKISKGELSRAKDYLLGQIAMNLERPQGMMFYLAENYLTLDKIYDFTQVREKIESIDPEQIRNLALKIFNFKNVNVSCVGNVDKSIAKKIKSTIKKYA